MPDIEDDNLIDESTIEIFGPAAWGPFIVKRGDKLTITVYGHARMKNKPDSIVLLGKIAEKLDKPIQG